MTDFSGLSGLDAASITKLAEWLEAGYLKPPFSSLSLQGHVARDHIDLVAHFLTTLDAAEVTPANIAVVLRAYAAGRSADRNLADLIEIVASGPDAAAAARDTAVVMRQLFGRAQQRVLAVGFAVYQGRSVFKALADSLDGEASFEATLCLDVRRPHGDSSQPGQIVSRFAQNFVENEWPGGRLPVVYFDPRSVDTTGPTRSALHAKCVVSDGREALVTSANFTEAAQERNIELGLLVDLPIVAGQIERHFYALIRDGHLDRLPLA